MCPPSQEQYFFPSKNIFGKRKCHTYGIITPDDKEDAQRLGVNINVTTTHHSLTHVRDHLQEVFAVKLYLNTMLIICFVCLQRAQLTEVILKLLGAWGGPLSQLYWSMSQDQNQDFNINSSNKALEISGMVHELRDGVAKMAEKVGIHMIMLIF